MKTAVIYKITNPTGRIYIGKTIDFTNRMTSYRNLNNPQQLIIHSSILKHGWENHQVEILEESIPENLNDLEIEYIKIHNSYHYENPLGMNLTRGGEGAIGRVDSIEVKAKRAQQLIGSKRNEDTKKRMSDLKKGKAPIASTLPRSKKQLDHLKYGNIGKKRSLKTIEKKLQTQLDKFLEQHGGIIQYSLDGIFIKEWYLLPKHIANIMDMDNSYFNKALKLGKKCCGYLWTYKTNSK